MAGAEILFLRLPGAGSVAMTVSRRAEVGAALDDAPQRGAAGTPAALPHFARVDLPCAGNVGLIEIRRPLPRIPDQVVETKPVRPETPDRREPDEAVVTGVENREHALPRIGLTRLPVGRCSRRATPRCPFPLRFRRQRAAFPSRVRRRVFITPW